jgi:TonB family protein
LLPGQTAVSGNITHHTRWFGQVIIDGDVTIPRGVNLTIEPGSRIIIRANFDKTRSGQDPDKIEIIIAGALYAFGEKGDGEIIFTSDAQKPQPGDWYGIVLKNITEPSTLRNGTIEYAYKSITCYGSSPEISDCEIRHNYYAGISCEIRSQAIIRNCFLIRNGFAGLVCELGSNPVVEKTTITANKNGIIIFDRSQPDLGRRSPQAGESAGENRIFDNAEVNIYNRSSNNIFAQNNLWNTGDIVEIHDKIIDKIDNPALGTIIFQPVFRVRPPFVIAAAQPPENPVLPSVQDSNFLAANPGGADSLLPDSAYENYLAALENRALSDSSLLKVRPDTALQLYQMKTGAAADSSNYAVWKVAGFTAAGAALAGAQTGGSPADVSPAGSESSSFTAPPVQPVAANPNVFPHVILERQVDRGQRHYIYRAKPVYPSIYQQTGFEGRVVVTLVVGYDGKVEAYQIVRSNGELFSYAVDKALKEMRYEPETYLGLPTRFKLFESFEFQLSD